MVKFRIFVNPENSSVSIEAQIRSRTKVVLADVSIRTDCKCEELGHTGVQSPTQYKKI